MKIDAGYKGDDEGKLSPFLKFHLEISKEELDDLRKKDKDTYFYFTRLIKRAATEADKGVQVY